MTTKPKTQALQLARSRKTGEIESINEVPPGKACDCVSISCNRPLIASNRGKSTDQPRASNELKEGVNLPDHHHWRELHNLEQQLIADAFTPFHKFHSAIKQQKIWPGVKLEHRMETPLGPVVVVDALAKSNPNLSLHSLAVEFRNTHPVDPEKLARLRSAGILTLEMLQ